MIDRSLSARTSGATRGLLRRVVRAGRAEVARRRTAVGARDVAAVRESIAATDPRAAAWVVRERRGGDPAMLVLGPADGRPAAIVRVARSAAAQAGLDRAEVALASLHERLVAVPDTDALVPVVVGAGTLRDGRWLAERSLPGTPGRAAIADPEARRRLLTATTAAIGAIHAATATETVAGDPEIERWIGARVRVVDALVAATRRTALRAVAADLAATLRGRTVATAWIHGDLWPDNVLVDDSAAASRLSGIVDWDTAEPGELPLQDRLHLAVTTRRLVERTDLGAVVAGLLRGGPWTDDDRVVLGESVASGIDALPVRTALWLYWLRFVATNVGRHPRLAADRRWLAANVDQVVACA